MSDRTAEFSPLAPGALEVGITVLAAVHVALVAFVAVQLLRRKMTLPHGVLGLVVLLVVSVVGPVLVLTWQGRAERRRARTQHSVA